ncbi:hypothetical protein ACP70R_048006 [Stipagrostis hirtigluma subsp. patula]
MSSIGGKKTVDLGAIQTNFNTIIWKVWAPPKCKLFAWLAVQNRLWTSDRLAARGWPNGGNCPLCRQLPETALHLLAECRYTKAIWRAVGDWLRTVQIRPEAWPPSDSVHQWWTQLASTTGAPKKGLRSAIILVSWEVWNERNARTFNRTERPAQSLIHRIKEEAAIWIWAGAKHLAQAIRGA